MRYLVSWKPRSGGSGKENEAVVERSLQLFGKWSPPQGATFHQFLTRIDGEGGYAVVESADPTLVMEGPAKFGPFFEFTVTPVIDIMEGIPIANEAVEFRKSIS